MELLAVLDALLLVLVMELLTVLDALLLVLVVLLLEAVVKRHQPSLDQSLSQYPSFIIRQAFMVPRRQRHRHVVPKPAVQAQWERLLFQDHGQPRPRRRIHNRVLDGCLKVRLQLVFSRMDGRSGRPVPSHEPRFITRLVMAQRHS